MASAQALSKPQRIKEGLGKVLPFLNWHSRTSNPSSTWHLLSKNSKNDCWATLVISHEKEQFVPKVTVLDGIQTISVLYFSSAAASGISVSTSFGGSPVGVFPFQENYTGLWGNFRLWKEGNPTWRKSKAACVRGQVCPCHTYLPGWNHPQPLQRSSLNSLRLLLITSEPPWIPLSLRKCRLIRKAWWEAEPLVCATSGTLSTLLKVMGFVSHLACQCLHPVVPQN